MLLAAIAMVLIGLTLGIWAASLVLRVLDEHLAALGRRWFPSLKPQRPVGSDSASAPTAVRPWQRWFAIMIGTLAMLASPVVLRQAYLFSIEDPLGNSRERLWDWWLLGAGLCVTLAVASMLLALRFDTPRGRRRCGKCWYDYTGLADTAACPECGRVSKNAADLRRTRGHRGMGWLAVFLLVAALGLWRTPAIIAGGPLRGVPTTVLILGMGVLPDDWIVPATGTRTGRGARLVDRIGNRELWDWQSSLVVARTMQVLQSDDSGHRIAAHACFELTNRSEAVAFDSVRINTLVRIALLAISSPNPIEQENGETFVSAVHDRGKDGLVIPDELVSQWRTLLHSSVHTQQRSAVTILATQSVLPDEQLREILASIGAAPATNSVFTPSLDGLVLRAQRLPAFEQRLVPLIQDTDSNIALASLATIARASPPQTAVPVWLQRGLNSQHPAVIDTALALARACTVVSAGEPSESADRVASRPGPLQTIALAILASQGLLTNAHQLRCLELIGSGNDEECRLAISCLLRAWPPDPMVTVEIEKLQNSGSYPECVNMPAHLFLDRLRIGSRRPEHTSPPAPAVKPP